MDTLIKVRTDLRYSYWRSYLTSLLVLLVSIGITVATTFALTLTSVPSVHSAVAHSNDSQQVAYQQFVNRYKDPSLAYFLGK